MALKRTTIAFQVDGGEETRIALRPWKLKLAADQGHVQHGLDVAMFATWLQVDPGVTYEEWGESLIAFDEVESAPLGQTTTADE